MKTNRPSPFRRDGWPTVAPRIVCADAQGLVRFVKRVFEARGEYREEHPSELWIGESVIMITEAGVRAVMAAVLYVYVADTDATYRRALKKGAQSIEAPVAMPYGDYRCMVEDNWGNSWQIATLRATRVGSQEAVVEK